MLGEAARQRLADLGYDNIEIRVGDGADGWPQAAPFDAILVPAGSPEVPQALKQQLAAGGQMVIPLGKQSYQKLKKITRCSETDFREENIGSVAFVPLISESGTAGDGAPPGRATRPITWPCTRDRRWSAWSPEWMRRLQIPALPGRRRGNR